MLKYDYTDNEIVLCREFTYDAEAHIALSALERAGIGAVIDGEFFSSIYPGLPQIAALRVMVRRVDLERALDVIDSLNFEGC